MKISIITVCLDSEKTIPYTLNSVLSQTYKDIEHIIVDGGSRDSTLKILKEYPFKKKKIIKTNIKGIYHAMNLGIKKAKGEIIFTLNSDDILNSNETIEKVMTIIKAKNYDSFIGNVAFFDEQFEKLTRYYPSTNFKEYLLRFGLMPPHTATFIKKKIYDKLGIYKTNYKIAADFEFLLRVYLINKISFHKLDILVTRMKSGGISGKNFFAYIVSTIEILRAFKENKIYSNLFFILLRIPIKIRQFYFYDNKYLNVNYNFYYSKFLRKLIPPNFRIINNINYIFKINNFILSAMNLAFIGSFIKGDIKKNINLIHWADGYFSKMIDFNIKKIPGRLLLKKIRVSPDIKEILIFGNLSKKSLDTLKKLYKKKIIHRQLGYGKNTSSLLKKVNCTIKKKQLVFLTLPTPKQEIVAEYLSKVNKHYKIICIGGSIAMLSGEEMPVPKFLSYFEFIWRLRYETYRRLKRLISTFFYYSYGTLFTNKLKNIKIEYLS